MALFVQALLPLLALSAGAASQYPPYPSGVPASFDCAWRELALEYATRIREDSRDKVFDALQLKTLCNASDLDRSSSKSDKVFPPSLPTPEEGTNIFVDWSAGSDENPGTQDKPKKTIQAAVQASRQATKPVAILLRNGTHYLSDTIHLGADDSGLKIQNFNGEEAWISGGLALTNLKWKVYNLTKPQPTRMVVFPGSFNVAGVANKSAPCSVAPNEMACQERCLNNVSCTSFTYYDVPRGNVAHQCCLRFDGIWDPRPVRRRTSGYKKAGYSLNVYVTDLSDMLGDSPIDITGLRVNGKRVARARVPNGDPEITKWPEGWFSSLTVKEWLPAHHFDSPTQVNVSKPYRNVSGKYMHYVVGIGGSCSIFEPPVSYWCQLHPAGGGAFEYYIPSGLAFKDGTITNHWKNYDGAVIQAWRRAHWASWMFALDKYDADNNTLSWTLGGFQGARGGPGSDWYVDGVLEELDAPTEWYFDKQTKLLYYYHNASVGTPPPNDLHFTATQVKVLFNITGTQEKPIESVSFQGLGFRDTAYTYLDPHGVPSGGDWALERMGAIFIQGSSLVAINSSHFERLDGNGVMLSGYNHNASIMWNEFAWMGGSAMAAWGITDELSGGGVHGYDGTDGNFPRFTMVTKNIVHEVGIWAKQSSAWFQAKSAQNYIGYNIIFNLARAGINFNDGFGGGSEVEGNIIFNTCIESQDHGPINSWDRQPFLTTVRTGQPSMIPEFNDIHHNFLVSNYGGVKGGVDNDDYSTFYKVHHNFNVFGWGPKSGGGGLQYYESIHAYIGEGMKYPPSYYASPDYTNTFNNNTLIFANGSSMYIFEPRGCGDPKEEPDFPITHGNMVYHDPHSPVYVLCGNTNYTIGEFQAKMHLDPGTKDIPSWPSDKEIISLAMKLLQMTE